MGNLGLREIISAYMCEIGRKGGKVKGEKKRRAPEHYKMMTARSIEARKKRRDELPELPTDTKA